MSRLVRAPVLMLVALATVAGCASSAPPALPPPPPPGTALLARADELTGLGEYARAIEAYDVYLQLHDGAVAVPRVRATRAALAGVVAARAEVARLAGELSAREREIGRLRQALVAREQDLGRVGEELAARDVELFRARQELARLAGEADRLRADIERLKQMDLRLEQRR